MIALPSDVARASPDVKSSYQELLEAMVWLFETSIEAKEEKTENAREKALTLAALCVGGMILARTLPKSDLAAEVRVAAQNSAIEMAHM